MQIKLPDAKILLKDVLQKQFSDSLVIQYEKLDKTRLESYRLLNDKLTYTETKLNNTELMVTGLNTVVSNKDLEIKKLNDTISAQSKEITKQKTLKILGFSAAILIPITTILLLSK